MGKKEITKSKKKTKITIIEIFIIIAIIAIVGNFIYQLTHYREAYDQMKKIGVLGTIAIFVAVFYIKKWIDKLEKRKEINFTITYKAFQLTSGTARLLFLPS